MVNAKTRVAMRILCNLLVQICGRTSRKKEKKEHRENKRDWKIQLRSPVYFTTDDIMEQIQEWDEMFTNMLEV